MTTKRFTILYGLDEDPFDWDILDNEKDAIICQYNGTPICELLNELHEENEQLKQRNNRQAKQLDRLYNLIEQKDWRTLNDILDDFKRCEEQLQREWRTYK